MKLKSCSGSYVDDSATAIRLQQASRHSVLWKVAFEGCDTFADFRILVLAHPLKAANKCTVSLYGDTAVEYH